MEEYRPQIYRVVVLTLVTLSRGRIHTINIISGHSHYSCRAQKYRLEIKPNIILSFGHRHHLIYSCQEFGHLEYNT